MRPTSATSPRQSDTLNTRPTGSTSVPISKFPVAIDTRLQHLYDHVVPHDPYLLTVPSDVPYRHSSRFVNNWFFNTPFSSAEEQIQYVSFLPHQGDHETLLRVEGGWSNDQGTILEDNPSPPQAFTSGRNTPADGSQRKKISLKDYKIKDKTSVGPTTDSKAEEAALKTDVDGNKKMSAIKSTEGDSQQSTSSLDTSKKRKRGNSEPKQAVKSEGRTPLIKLSDHDEGSRPNGIAKTTVQGPHVLAPIVKQEVSRSPNRTKEMPKMLSPTLPSAEKKRVLPPLLDPSLPSSLVKAASSPVVSDNEGTVHKRTDSVRSIISAALDTIPSTDKVATKSGSLALEGRVRSDSQHSESRSPNSKAVSKPLSKLGTPQRASPGPRQRHIICLKYGKKNRKRVEGLLKFAARPKKVIPRPTTGIESARPPPPAVANEAPKTATATAVEPTKPPPPEVSASRPAKGEKRPADSIPKPVSKKLKPSAAIKEPTEKPTTPVPRPTTPSVAFSGPGALAKSVFTTPKKDLKSAAMRRVESAEGGDARTPSNEVARTSTPMSVDRAATARTSPGVTSAATDRGDDRTGWANLNSSFFGLGRSIKHEGTSHGPDAGSHDAALGVIQQIEALLCFMITNTAQAYARPKADPGWSSIVGYHDFVYRSSRKYSHLHGLVIQLGAVCRQYIHKFEIDRLARDPLPDEHVGSAPTPGSDGNTKTNDDAEKYKKRYVEFRDGLVQNARELQRAWSDGLRLLSIEILEHEYPKTWSKRSRDANSRGFERATPTKVPAEYYLPLDPTTTAFEATRFALSFLAEWATKENIKWTQKIDL